MSRQILSHSVLALLISAYPFIPVIAEALPANPSTQSNQVNPLNPPPEPSVQLDREVIVPEFSVIAVAFCSAIKFENERDDHFPVTLFLARPIMDANGEIVAPVNSLVSAQVEPTSRGVKIQVDALVVGGRLIPVKTAALSIPILSTVKEDPYGDYAYGDGGSYYAPQPGRGLALSVANGLQYWLPNQEFLPGTASSLLGAGLAIAAGVAAATDKPKREKLIEVPEGGTLIFPLLSPVTLPSTVMRVALSPVAQTPMALCAADATQNLSDEASNQSSNETSNNKSSNRTSKNDYD